MYQGISDFIFMKDPLQEADIILIPGGSVEGLAKKAADLYHLGYGGYILPSGGYNKKISAYANEYEFLKEVLLEAGVPEEAILKENKASHTFDNASLSRQVIESHGLLVNRAILVTKAYHARRAYQTYKLYFPQVDIRVCPVADRLDISKDNWYLDPLKVDKVMGEVTKVATYFKAHFKEMIKG